MCLMFAVNRLPVFTQNISVINVTLGETYRLVLEAEDADDDELTFTAPFLPPGASITSNGNRLTLTWLVDSAESVCLIQYL